MLPPVPCTVIRFPGSNREQDLLSALRKITPHPPTLIDSAATTIPPQTKVILLPGGFAWGDYLRAGALAAFEPIIPALKQHAKKGTLVIGICNGFQILTETQLLPGTLTKNTSGQFICAWQNLQFQHPDKPTEQKTLRIPIAHSEGKYYAPPNILEALEKNKQIFLRYANNPNGSANDIAGICDSTRRIFALMPHPENAVQPFHASQDGLLLLRSLLAKANPSQQISPQQTSLKPA